MTERTGPHFDVRVVESDDFWHIKIDDLGQIGVPFGGKDEAVRAGAAVAEAVAFCTHGTAELYVHKRDGTFEDRRTYPRSADPTESEG